VPNFGQSEVSFRDVMGFGVGNVTKLKGRTMHFLYSCQLMKKEMSWKFERWIWIASCMVGQVITG